METSEPDFYYIFREANGEFAGIHKTRQNYSANVKFAGFDLEPTTKSYFETIREFESVARLPIFDGAGDGGEWFAVSE